MFSGYTVPPGTKETKLEGATKEVFYQQVKMFLCHVRARQCVPTAISGGVDVFVALGCHLM